MILYVKTEEFNSRMNLIERQVYGQLSAAFLLLLQRVEAETWPMVQGNMDTYKTVLVTYSYPTYPECRLL
jgi:hypothetical protein